MRTIFTSQLFGFAIGFVFVAAGCGGPRHDFAEVEGKVTLNKKPLAGVMVRFYPVSPGREQLPIAAGFTDETGMYTLTHHGDKPGALVGPNKAVVSWPSRDVRSARREGAPLPAPSATIPIEYTVVSDTPLTVEVKPGGPHTIDLHLTD